MTPQPPLGAIADGTAPARAVRAELDRILSSEIYFVGEPAAGGLGQATRLKRVSSAGGPVDSMDVAVMTGAWEVTDTAIVFIVDNRQELIRGPRVLQRYSFADGQVRTLGRLDFATASVGLMIIGSSRYLAVSHDDRWALVTKMDRWDRDILVLDGFR